METPTCTVEPGRYRVTASQTRGPKTPTANHKPTAPTSKTRLIVTPASNPETIVREIRRPAQGCVPKRVSRWECAVTAPSPNTPKLGPTSEPSFFVMHRLSLSAGPLLSDRRP